MTEPRQGMSLPDWLAALAAELPDPASAAASAEEQEAILDLARVAAHTSERIAAPISALIVGVAFADLAPAERAGRIRALTRRLEGRD